MGATVRCGALLVFLVSAALLRVAALQRPFRRDKFGLPIGRFSMEVSRNGRIMNSELDELWLGFWVQLRHGSMRARADGLVVGGLFERQRAQGKMQAIVPPSDPFPCNLSATAMRSEQPPSSVHRLRPGDVDIVATMGDSLLAGSGIVSETVIDIMNEYRSLVFTTGGRGTWRNYLTLANILRVYNAQLYGQAVRDGLTVDRSSVFNVAEAAALSRDLLYQARVLIKRMRRDKRVDMRRHWKLLTIFIGNNDVCTDMCHFDSPSAVLRQHERDLRAMLTELRDQVPRLFINLMPAVNPTNYVHKMRAKPLGCELSHKVVCNCLFRAGSTAADVNRASAFIRKWQAVDERIAALPEFRTDDFVVIYRDFLSYPSVHKLANGATDYGPMAADCFHFSQMGQALVANALWNSMFAVANFSQLRRPFGRFECPTAERPFLVTWANNGGGAGLA